MKKTIGAFITALLMCTSFVGCSSDKETVSTDGSTSMEKVISVLGKTFEQDTGITVTYNPTGSGSGIKAASSGTCDIGLSSRSLKDDEKAQGLTETVLAYDGIAIVVNNENPINNLDMATLTDIYTGKISNWSEVGGNNEEIVLIGREAGSGTRDGFESVTGTENQCKYRQDLTSTGDVITTVAGNPSAIGYTSVAAVKDSVKPLTVNDIYPTEETIKDGSYVIQRPFVLVTKTDTQLSDSAKKFFDYVTSEKARDAISSVGFVPAN